MKPSSQQKLHISTEYNTEVEPERNFDRLKYDEDGVVQPYGRWSPPYRLEARRDPELSAGAAGLNSGRLGEILDDYRDNDGDDDVEDNGETEESSSGFGNSKERIEASDDNDDDYDAADREEDFEKLKAVSSTVGVEDDSEISPRLGALNRTDNEKLNELPGEYRMDKMKEGDNNLSYPVNESVESNSKSDVGGDKKRTTLKATLVISEGNTSPVKELSTQGLKRILNKSTMTSDKQDGRLTKLPGRRTTTASTKRANDSVHGFDDDSIAQMIAESAPGHVNDTTYDIVDQGLDKVDVPITGSSNWKPVIHGIRQIVAGGSIIAIIGFLVLGFSIFNFLLNRNTRTSQNINNSNRRNRPVNKETAAISGEDSGDEREDELDALLT